MADIQAIVQDQDRIKELSQQLEEVRKQETEIVVELRQLIYKIEKK